MASNAKLDPQTLLDGLGQGVLIFNNNGDLISDNLAARTLLGKDMTLIRNNGWDAVSALFNSRQTDPDSMIEAVRDRALQSERPVRFYIYLSGQHIPGYASAIQGTDGEVHIMLSIEMPDWTALTKLVEPFRIEMKDTTDATQGHIDLIEQTMNHYTDDDVETMTKRISGFTRLISIHMHRTGRLMDMLERLEAIRTGSIRDVVKTRRRKVNLADYLEDFVEELDEIALVDPETESRDHRSRLTVDVPDGVAVWASTSHLRQILHDILRNAIMYSMKATPIKLKVYAKENQVQFDLTDEGYGIREKERERVFEGFQRARQPQIIAEFGYGLSLYLCKYEVEAMNGRLWFESDEAVGTTFSFMLPMWREETETVQESSSASSSLSNSDSSEDTAGAG